MFVEMFNKYFQHLHESCGNLRRTQENQRVDCRLGWCFCEKSTIANKISLNIMHVVLLIERLHAVHVRSRVDEPCDVQGENVTENTGQEERRFERFAEEEPRHHCRNHDAYQKHQTEIIIVLEHDVGIGFQVAHVDLNAELLHVRVFFAQQPAHVREEEAASRVVWISVGIAKFMVNAEAINIKFQ